MSFGHMRIARPVTDLNRGSEMYRYGQGIKTTGHFINHRGFSGIMLGRSDLPWHIEFTHCLTHAVTPTQTVEDLLVWYFFERAEWNLACQKMNGAGFSTVKSFNPLLGYIRKNLRRYGWLPDGITMSALAKYVSPGSLKPAGKIEKRLAVILLFTVSSLNTYHSAKLAYLPRLQEFHLDGSQAIRSPIYQ